MEQETSNFIGINLDKMNGIEPSYASHISDDGSSLVGDVSNDDQNIYTSTLEDQELLLTELGIPTNAFGDLT